MLDSQKSKYLDVYARVNPVERFSFLERYRNDVLEVARECSALTNPSVVPPSGHEPGARLVCPEQSHGSRLVSNMVNNLLLVLFPPGLPFFKLDLREVDVKNMAKTMALPNGQDMYAAMRTSFVNIENECAQQFDLLRYRDKVALMLQQLIIGGSSCYLTLADTIDLIPLEDWVCVRSKSGDILEGIYRELTDLGEVEYVRAFHYGNQKNWTVDRYREDGTLVDTADFAKLPVHFPVWDLAAGEDYGRGLCEENLGDLRQLDSGSTIINESAAALAKVIVTVNPVGVTKLEDVAEARNTDIISGNAGDVSVIQAAKTYDFSSFVNYINGIRQNLDKAFMMAESMQRQAERVTAEEIRKLAQELEKSRGGIYGRLALSIQSPIAELVLRQTLSLGNWQLSMSDLVPIISTGLQGLGRSVELENTVSYLQLLTMIPGWEALLKPREAAVRLATLKSLEVEDLLKTAEELAQEAQAASVNSAVDTMVPEFVKGAMRNDQR